MPLLKNSRHEKFAQVIAKGESAAGAYRKVYRSKASVCETNGPRLLGKAQVSARVAEIKGKAADLVTWSVAERLEFLKEAALTPPTKIKLGSRICQGERITKDGSSYLLIPDKIKATVEYGRLAGDYKEKVEISGDGLLELLESMRGGK